MTIVLIGSYYFYAGIAVAAVFLLFGMGRLDENAQGAWVFRPLLIPGVLLIWPLVIWRWIVLSRGEEKLDRHKMPRIRQERAQLLFAIVIPLIIVLALIVKQNPDTLPGPVMLEAAK